MKHDETTRGALLGWVSLIVSEVAVVAAVIYWTWNILDMVL